MTLSLQRRIQIAFATALLTLVVVGAVSYLSTLQFSAAARERQRTYRIRDRLDDLLSGLSDAETGQRGYLLTGREPYLEPYHAGRTAVLVSLGALDTLFVPDTALHSRLAALTPTIAAKLTELQATIDLRRAGRLAAALDVLSHGRGKSLMDTIRVRIAALQQLEREQTGRWEARLASTRLAVRLTTVGGVLLALIFLSVAVRVIGREMAARGKAEEHLRHVSEEMRDLFEHAPCGYHTLDTEGHFVAVNATELAWLGYRAEELIGKRTVFDVLAPANRERSRARFQVLVDGGEITPGSVVFERKDGSQFPGLVNSRFVRDAEGRVVQIRATLVDETDAQAARQTMERLNDQLTRHVAELEEVNRQLESFSYSVSHDLRAPLRAIAGFARLLGEEHAPALDAEGLRLLGVIRGSTERMGRLIDDLLSFSRLSRKALEVVPVDMAALVRGLLTERRAADGQGAEFEVRSLPPASGDATLLRQVWANLIDNGVKYSKRSATPRIEIGARSDQGITTYYVRDNGVGFDMQYAGKLFGVFQRLHAQADFEGNGVGLAIAQRVVHRHGGKIWAESAPGAGATFYFTLANGAVT